MTHTKERESKLKSKCEERERKDAPCARIGDDLLRTPSLQPVRTCTQRQPYWRTGVLKRKACSQTSRRRCVGRFLHRHRKPRPLPHLVKGPRHPPCKPSPSSQTITATSKSPDPTSVKRPAKHIALPTSERLLARRQKRWAIVESKQVEQLTFLVLWATKPKLSALCSQSILLRSEAF